MGVGSRDVGDCSAEQEEGFINETCTTVALEMLAPAHVLLGGRGRGAGAVLVDEPLDGDAVAATHMIRQARLL